MSDAEPPAEWDTCGTYAGYQAHKRCEEQACGPCKAAAAAYMRQHRARPEVAEKEKARREARRRALSRLARVYPTMYRAFYEEELAR